MKVGLAQKLAGSGCSSAARDRPLLSQLDAACLAGLAEALEAELQLDAACLCAMPALIACISCESAHPDMLSCIKLR